MHPVKLPASPSRLLSRLVAGVLPILLMLCALPPCTVQAKEPLTQALPAKIDRRALVGRHDVRLEHIDPHAALMVGNGSLAFTADITGLQTFPEAYSPLVPLLTQAQWAWHSFPNPAHYRYEDSLVPVKVAGGTQYYPWLRDGSEARKPAIAWLRENPHRICLGRLSLHLLTREGRVARLADLTAPRQRLDLWSGTLLSHFELEGMPVEVQTQVHPDLDLLIVSFTSPAVAAGRLGVDLKFPGVSASLNPDPADWGHPGRHHTVVTSRSPQGLSLTRQLDDTRYFVKVGTSLPVTFTPLDAHGLRILPVEADGRLPGADTFTVMVLFSERPSSSALPEPEAAQRATREHWHQYWSTGAVVDLSGSTDSRAPELERRIVLSQYLMAVNAAGQVPPQEEGLFSNSWNGKFHLEMHLWHAAHFALWGHPELLERSMPWYLQHLKEAKARARSHGVQGAWWPKMVGPEGRESPSTINPFILWQQPTPIYFSELLYRAKPSQATLRRYRELVFETADLLASRVSTQKGRPVLGPPVIPAQEVYPPLETSDPSFELEYFRFGLLTAQAWRRRLGLPPNAAWEAAIGRLTGALPRGAGLYLPVGSVPQFWEQAARPPCAGEHAAATCLNRDHPSLLGAFGLLPGDDVDRETMRRTLDAVLTHWDLQQTWGWDFPLLAMTATRLHQPERALDLLFRDVPNNRWGITGMTPRVEWPDTAGKDASPGHRLAETYFPSNGSLLLAIALMVAGWDAEQLAAPGFPHDGRWQVRSEGLLPLP